MKAKPTTTARKAVGLLSAVVLTAGGCTSSSAEPPTTEPAPASTSTTTPTTTTTTTTTTLPPTTTTTTTIAPRPEAEVPVFADDGEVIEPDGDLVMGTLENGLVYYIRANDRPGLRAELRLAVRAGSLQEADDQSGAAHYVEHMLFNGTEKYPSNDLIRVLQEFGSEFGPDINAYTTYEETVYELTLPTDRADLLPSGFDVLREWATAATIDPEEVELERGVLVEEWRVRSQGFWGRYYEGVIDRLLRGTPYEGHETLADPETLETTTPEALRAFYDAWYRPELMAVIAVGDFDVAATEALINDVFGDIPPSEGPPQSDPSTAPATEPAFLILADPEYSKSFVELNYPLPTLPAGTVGTLRHETAFRLAWEMLVTRLEEDTLRGVTAFYDPSGAANPLVRTQQSPGLFAWAAPADLAETAEALLTEVERALIHGFDQGELDRAVDAVRSEVELEFERSNTTQDAAYAARYVDHFLGNTPVPSADRAADLRHRLLDEMTVEQVTATFRANIQSTDPLVIVAGPEDDAAEIPTETDLAAILDRVRTSNLDARIDAVPEIDQLMDWPTPSDAPWIDYLPATTLEILILENGARMILVPTDVTENLLYLGATSFGGWSLLPEEDATEAQLISDVVTKSGVAEFDQVTLSRYLGDRIVHISPYIGETSEGLFGSASTDEIETLFQLLYLYMTAPRADDVGLELTIDAIRPLADDPGSDPQFAVDLELARVRFGGDPRFLPLPSTGDLDTFDLDRGLEIYRERFADAADFVFVLAGDFDPANAEDLARRFIGTLPAAGGGETYADVRIERPPEIVARVVSAGTGELGELALLWDAAVDLDPVTRIEAALLDLVIRQRLTERIREELSSTYSPVTNLGDADDPTPLIELSISISADPADLDDVAAEVIADLADLRDNGPTAEEMFIAQEQLVRQLELYSNEGIIETLTFYLLRPQEDPEEIFLEIQRAIDATPADLRELARRVISLDDYIQIQLVPESSG